MYNVARPHFRKLGFHFTAPIRIASENCIVVDSKDNFVAFKTLMSIIFQAEYSIAFSPFIFCSSIIGKVRKYILTRPNTTTTCRYLLDWLIVICKTKRYEMKICNLRNGNMLMIWKIEICNLRNRNMLMICKIEIAYGRFLFCKSLAYFHFAN